MSKKFIAVILCISFLAGLLPVNSQNVNAAEPESKNITILSDGKEVQEIQIKSDEKKVLTAKSSNNKIQWQIVADIKNDIWADIQGMNENEIEISYALVKSLLDMSGSTYIRCMSGEGENAIYSNPVCVTVTDDISLSSDDLAIENEVVKPKVLKNKKTKKEEKNPEYIYITVNYLGEDGKELYSSYKGQIEYGTDFVQKIIIPTYLGFGAFVNEADLGTKDPSTANERKYNLQLNYRNLTSDKVINVYYKPVEVPYAAKYFFQNIHDDMYSESTDKYYHGMAKTGTIIDDKTLNDNAGDLTGFTPLYHYPEAVAADGSTVFNVYYDRNYYLLNFDMDGGYGTEPVYARYKTPFAINNPTKAGYTFAGWDLLTTDSDNDGILDTGDGIKDELSSTIPASNMRYKALWTRGNAEVTYVYWRENADDNGYSYWNSKKVGGFTSGDPVTYSDDISKIKSVDEKQYFTYNAEKTAAENEGKIVEGDGSTIVNVYYDRKEYTLKYYYARQKGTERPQVAVNTNGYPWVTEDNMQLKMEAGKNLWISVWDLPKIKDGSKWVSHSEKIGDYTYYYLEFTGKYNCDLSRDWPLRALEPVVTLDGNREVNFGAWCPENATYYIQNNSKFGNNVTVKGLFLRLDYRILNANNADDNVIKFLGYWAGNKDWGGPYKWIYHIAIPKLNGSGYEEKAQFVTYDQNENIDEQTPTSIEGFSHIESTAQKDSDRTWHAYFKYDRKSYNLKYYNYNDYLSAAESIPYNMPMEGKSITPSYPKDLEKDAFEFAGWYTSPECVDGTEYDFSKENMPAKDLTLYAKWAPVKHKVNFFQTKEDMLAYEKDPANVTPLETREIEHGKILGSVDNPPSLKDNKAEYVFGGWFYMKNGKRVAYTPLDIPVTRDLNVYAEWGSKIAQPYKIRYVLKNNPSVSVAPDTIGYAYQGSTRTFSCKVGNPYNQLYPEYNNGYFPTLASHSITMQYEEDKTNPVHNVYTFEYVQAKDIEYTVRYVDAITNEPLAKEVTKKTSNGVITERFETISGYVPDAFYKRLNISVIKDSDGQYISSPDNVITFYYTKSETTAFYAVHHMLQKPGTNGNTKYIDGSGDYTESSTYVEGIADFNSTISLKPMEFTGFKPAKNAKQVINGKQTIVEKNTGGEYNITIDKNGTELYIFYDRQKYPYKVRYREYNSPDTAPDIQTKVANPKEYDSIVEEKPIDIVGYAPISNEPKSLTIKEEKDKNNITTNVITFYYTKLQYMAEYKVSGDAGQVSQGMETIEGSMSFNGSKPMPDKGYKFAGWYTDKECKNPVTEDIATIDPDTNVIVPNKSKANPSPAVNTFYAKFLPITGSLTISRNGAEDEGNGDQVFVYRVTDMNDDKGNYFDVTLKGNGSVTIIDLFAGDYKVEQLNKWSWRYDDISADIKISEDATTSVEFNKASNKHFWLNGNSTVKVNVKGGR